MYVSPILSLYDTTAETAPQVDDEILEASDDEAKKGDEDDIGVDKLISASKPKPQKAAAKTSMMMKASVKSAKQPRGKVKPKR